MGPKGPKNLNKKPPLPNKRINGENNFPIKPPLRIAPIPPIDFLIESNLPLPLPLGSFLSSRPSRAFGLPEPPLSFDNSTASSLFLRSICLSKSNAFTNEGAFFM